MAGQAEPEHWDYGLHRRLRRQRNAASRRKNGTDRRGHVSTHGTDRRG
jgi:hypothetical protein